VKLLELLKARFGEAPLQSCEVMMKDIQDSLRVDKAVREAKGLNPSSEEITQARRAMARNRDQTSINAEGFLRPSIHTKILSRLFWPQLHEGTYKVPSEIALLQDAYEKGFETLKNARKLKWLNTLGQAVVELELKDRVVKEEVWTWQAAVIYAFQDNDKTGDGGGAIRQCKDLAIELEMDESLVRKACQFWAEKQVLEEQGGGVFQVLESLEHQTPDRSKAAAMAREKTHISEDDDFQDGNMVMNGDMQIYWQFIQGMLKNSAAQMPLQQIAMMLKMLVADGFPYSNEQLGAFLAKKIDGGELELAGGKYKLKK
jgi:anaphase-promoting complex subunit 2